MLKGKAYIALAVLLFVFSISACGEHTELADAELDQRLSASDDGADAFCDPMDAKPVGMCAMVLGVTYAGPDHGCVYISGCYCDGSDCDDLYSDIPSCERDYHQCLPDPICEPWDAAGEGACKMILGYAYDGDECVQLSGCECVGDDCDLVTSTKEECQEVIKEACGE